MKNLPEKDPKEFYLFPYISTYQSLEDIKSSDEPKRFVYKHDRMSVADAATLNAISRAFIISEPGYGKSRLLGKLAQDLPPGKAKSIDLKQSLDNNETLYENWDSEVSHIYFDGLDEVSAIQFSLALDKIETLSGQVPNLHIFISCRTHYLMRWQSRLQEFPDFKFVVIEQFSEVHIRQYLEHFLGNEDMVQSILNKSAGSNRDSVLRTPRYLEGLVRSILAGQWTIAELNTLTRVQIFEKVIYYQLFTETSKKQNAIKKQLKENAAKNNSGITLILEHIRKRESDDASHNELLITQRVLEKLALIMEIYQRNRITKDELISFLDETHSNVNQAFLQNFSINTFIERTLKSVEFDYLEFENTEFQEYLAAKELIRMSNSEQVLYDLIIEKQLQIILTNWFDVIQYAIELEPDKVAGGLANYLSAQPQRQVEERLIDLLLGPGMESADENIKKNVFTAVFTYFQYNGGYLYHKDERLAALYHPDLESLLSLSPPQNTTPAETMRFINSLLVTGKVCARGMFSEPLRIEWVSYLIGSITQPDKSPKFEEIFYGLEAFGAHAELIALYPKIRERSDQIIEWYLDSLGRVAPDRSVDIFIDILENKPGVNSKERFFDDLTTLPAIHSVLDILLSNNILIESLFSNRWSFTGFYSLFDQIKRYRNESLDQKVEQLFYVIADSDDYPYLSGTKKAFMERAIRYFFENNEGFFDRFLKSNVHANILQELAEAISGVISIDQFAKIENKASQQTIRYYDLRKLIGHMERDGSYSRKPVIAGIKERFGHLFKERKPETRPIEREKQDSLKKQYAQFKKLLKPGKNSFNGDVFKYYFEHYETLLPLIQPAEHAEIRQLIRDIISNVETEGFRITVKNEKDRINYQLNNSWWFNFGFFVRMALFLEEKEILAANRDKIIKYLPLLRDYNVDNIEVIEPIMTFLGPLTDADMEILWAYCAERKDDYVFSAASSFIDLIKDYQLISLAPFLQQIISSDVTAGYEKIKALKCYEDINNRKTADRAYLTRLFREFNLNNESKRQLADLANEILITIYADESAISWRFEELKKRKILLDDEPVRRNGIRPYPEWEVELDKPQFGKCLNVHRDHSTQQRIFDLLEYALSIRPLDRHKRYSEYLMVIVFEYFENNNDLKNINSINSILTRSEYSGTAVAFKSHLVKLEKQLSSVLARHDSISDPVRIYNSIKASRYLPIYNQRALSEIINASVTDLENFVFNKGYAHTALQLSGEKQSKNTRLFNEDILQKTLAVQLENSLMRKGIREADILREVQLSDDQRLDLLVKYGFIGPVMIELKLLHNPEIQNQTKRRAYLDKLTKYMRGIGADHAIYLIFKVRQSTTAEMTALSELYEEYQHAAGLEIKFIDCTKGFV
ncbi:hypothetical protein D0C36_20040 [Mucilaginibacter conchicola]|uniref:Uncharacterized protein n=1 Tax=Mucilaginibacter conchicola TaxID=2303333 RepID=A0A372NQL4_9SPHI|nr:hypothetical protein [Mucilaginibacter conchicola]RFZ91229.1 hypothetical protein D0C36_20040 [Mucilaginibacter conchicola]